MRELLALIGRTGVYSNCKGWSVRVKVLDVKSSYGVDKLLVQSIDFPQETQYINRDNFKEEPAHVS